MFSYPGPREVVSDLGDKVVNGLAAATRKTRVDLEVYRSAQPLWVADHSNRGLANWLHDRLWANLRRELGDVSSVTFLESGVRREVTVNTRYRARVKRHDQSDRVRSFPTDAARAFWTQDAMLQELEEVRLGFGYRWGPETRAVERAVISLRDGLDQEALWAIELDDETAASTGGQIQYTPVQPTLPQLDLASAVDDDDEEGTTT